MRYLNKVIFINSANIPYSEIVLDGNVHFIGTQGVGKSTLLRAILFFYNADKLKLGIEKGKKTFDEYYFPYGNSYVVYEVIRETGPYCILAVKSQGRVCFRFINSGYDQQNFVGTDGKVKSWDGIRDSLGKRVNYTKKIDRYEDYRDILYGNNSGLEKEFRKYALLESKQYQNIPRTIQNVFLNSKLDAEFIKQTIIMSLNEEDVRIELDKYALHLKDFDTELADINKWTEINKSGEIPVRKMAENISRIHTAINSLDTEKQETAIQLFEAYGAAVEELPQIEKEYDVQKARRDAMQAKSDDLKGKFQAKKEDIQKQINILDNELKKAKTKTEDYDRINIGAIIKRVEQKEQNETDREKLLKERELLSARFSEINARYDALVLQNKNDLAGFQNGHQSRKNKLREDFLQFKSDLAEQYQQAYAQIRKQHQAALEIARNTIAQKKENIHDLKLKKQKAQLLHYFEQDIEKVKTDIDGLHQRIRNASADIADHKKQTETLQKQWELDLEKSNASYDRRIEKLREDSKQYAGSITAIDTKLQNNKDALFGWLGGNMPGWEHTIGKVVDEEQVLFHTGLSPQFAEGAADTIFGLKIDLGEIKKKVRTVADYEQEKEQLLKKLETNNAQINTIIEQRNEEADKLKTRYQNKIKDLNAARKQLEYELQRSKGQLPVNEVRLADLVRKAAGEKERVIDQLNHETGIVSEALINEENQFKTIEAGIQRQVEQKEKEYTKKVKTESQRLKEIVDSLDLEVLDRQLEILMRIEEIKQLQSTDLRQEGADVERISGIEKALGAIQREMDFIEANRDKVAEYKKDKRELLDHVDAYKTDKRLKESQLDNEQEKYSLQKQKLQQDIDLLIAVINDLAKKLSGNFRQVAEYMGQSSGKETTAGLKTLIDELNGKIYTLLERYNDLQSAINKFLGNFSSQNIFGFKTNLIEKEDFISFAEMLNEFLEEDKIVQYEKRVNERFAALIRQIGKETTDLTSKGGEIQKVITEINRDFEERNFAGVIRSIKLQLSASRNSIVTLLQDIKQFNDKYSMSLGAVNLFSTGDNEGQNKKAVSLLKEFAKEINARKEKEISLPDSFELQFRIVENENDSGWVEKLTHVGSEGTDILVKAMINIMLLNVFKVSASKRFKEFRLHCMMDEIGKLHPNNVKGILKFANDRNILLINSSPTSYNAIDYRYTYLLSKDSKNITNVKRLIKKGVEA
jgi:plasmid maintenance system antidote protein VapI